MLPDEEDQTEPQPPVEEPPAGDPPAEDPPAEDPPVEDPPAEDPPVEEPPVEDPPTEDPPAPPRGDDDEEDERAEFRESLDASFGGDKFEGQARATANRFATLAKHIADVVPKSQAQTVALRKLIKARNAVLRALANT